jgi:hypothetical protein
VLPSITYSRAATGENFIAHVGRRSMDAGRALADVRTWLPLLLTQMRRLGVDSVPIALFIAVFTGIVLSLLFGSIDFFREIPVHEFLFGTSWAPGFVDGGYGVIPLLVGTLNVVFWALVVAIPVGLMSAIYLAREPERVLRLATLAVMHRAGESGLVPKGAVRVETRRVDVSSTEIRERVRTGRSIRGFVPDAVAAYIAEQRLYR